MLELITVIIFLGLMVVAWFYVQKVKHRKTKPIAAFMVFMVIFSTTSIIMFMGLGYLSAAIDLKSFFEGLPGSLIFLALVFCPAFLIARWQLHRPPFKERMPD